MPNENIESEPPRSEPSRSDPPESRSPRSESAMRLRALAHPLRWKLIDLTGSGRSVTATQASKALGESVASCSYHLGILGKYGYLEQITDAPGRERPWREVGGGQNLSAPSDDIEDQLASTAAAEAFLDHELERMKTRQRLKDGEPEEWARATMIGGSGMWVTADELHEIRRELLAVLHRHELRSNDPQLRPAGAREARVFVSTSVRPNS